MNYHIKITGSGTAEELLKALRDVVANIEEAKRGEHETAMLDGATWEDATLCTEILVEGTLTIPE
jgi:hypothetical protein